MPRIPYERSFVPFDNFWMNAIVLAVVLIVGLVLWAIISQEKALRRQEESLKQRRSEFYASAIAELCAILIGVELGRGEDQRRLQQKFRRPNASELFGYTYVYPTWAELAERYGDAELIERVKRLTEVARVAIHQREIRSWVHRVKQVIAPHFIAWRRRQGSTSQQLSRLQLIVTEVKKQPEEVQSLVLAWLSRSMDELVIELESVIEKRVNELIDVYKGGSEPTKAMGKLRDLITSTRTGELKELGVKALALPSPWNEWVFEQFTNPAPEWFLDEPATSDLKPGELLLRAGQAVAASDPIEALIVHAHAVASKQAAVEIATLRGDLAMVIALARHEHADTSGLSK